MHGIRCFYNKIEIFSMQQTWQKRENEKKKFMNSEEAHTHTLYIIKYAHQACIFAIWHGDELCASNGDMQATFYLREKNS